MHTHKIHTIGALVLRKRSGTRIAMIELLMLLRFTGGSGRHRDSLLVLTTAIDSAADSRSGRRRFLEVLIERVVDDSLSIQRSSSSASYHLRSRQSSTSTHSISVHNLQFIHTQKNKNKNKKFPLPKNQSFLQIVEAEAESLDFLLQAPSLYIWGMKIEPSNLWC